MSRRVAAGAGAVLLAVAAVACSPTLPEPTLPEPTLPTLATSVTTTGQGGSVAITVEPWPLDDTTAFLCDDDPGDSFDADDRVPDAAAGCLKLETSRSGDTLEARIDPRSLTPEAVHGLGASPPWFLALAGRTGSLSASTVVLVPDVPVAAPPVPS